MNLYVLIFCISLSPDVISSEEETSIDANNSKTIPTSFEEQEISSKTDNPVNVSQSNLTNLTDSSNNRTSNTSVRIRPICTSEDGCNPPLHCCNISTINDTNTTGIIGQGKVVKVTSEKLQYILESPLYTNSCLLVMFYAVWCPYSVEFAPTFNSLGRHFPQILVLALDFGTEEHERFLLAYLPRVLLYYSGRAIYNIETTMSTDQLTKILTNMTGHTPLNISDEEFESINNESPLPIEWKFDSTWYKLSILVVSLIITVHILKRTSCASWIIQCRDSIRNVFAKLKKD